MNRTKTSSYAKANSTYLAYNEITSEDWIQIDSWSNHMVTVYDNVGSEAVYDACLLFDDPQSHNNTEYTGPDTNNYYILNQKHLTQEMVNNTPMFHLGDGIYVPKFDRYALLSGLLTYPNNSPYVIDSEGPYTANNAVSPVDLPIGNNAESYIGKLVDEKIHSAMPSESGTKLIPTVTR